MKKLFVILVVLLVLVGGGWLINTKLSKPEKTPVTKASFNKAMFKLTDPTSPWVIVNKQHPLNPRSYAPTDLTTPKVPLRYAEADPRMMVRAETADALERLVAAAKAEGIQLALASGYRSFDAQTTAYNSEVKAYGKEAADRESARPSHSEHQTGWAADLEPVSKKCSLQACFANTPEGKWLAKNAYIHGFVLRYQKNKEQTTGYIFEPWHIRYVGNLLANELHKQGNPVLEDFFELGPAPEYK